jgi:DNA-binding MarR family transcriptional regulator
LNSQVYCNIMATITTTLKFILDLSKAQATINRKMDGQLYIHGLSFNDFIILYHLSQAPGKKLRRIDLAEKMGVTASGITRMLAPMEKIGLVSREVNERDARITYAVLAPGGKRLFDEASKTAEHISGELFPENKTKRVEQLSEVLGGI